MSVYSHTSKYIRTSVCEPSYLLPGLAAPGTPIPDEITTHTHVIHFRTLGLCKQYVSKIVANVDSSRLQRHHNHCTYHVHTCSKILRSIMGRYESSRGFITVQRYLLLALSFRVDSGTTPPFEPPRPRPPLSTFFSLLLLNTTAENVAPPLVVGPVRPLPFGPSEARLHLLEVA